ncbi:protein translocase subunit SecF [Marinimicrobium agarilyticum]|uniref:protein translocase subunit SecF n=1 Tax=Marinimicrobium agarilyticum TaxID=306546 RepID=UPI00041DA233|nr:protein translocase subunit SecF [Marinimicrobium agarilyticum]
MSQEAKIINFMGWRKTAATISIVLLVGSILALAVRGIEFGLDFTGGSQIELGFDQPADLGTIRDVLSDEGLENPVAVFFGSDSEVLIRTQDALSDGVVEQLEEDVAALSSGATLVDVRNAPSNEVQFSEVLVFAGVDEQTLRNANLFDADYFGKTRITTEGDQVKVFVQNALDNVYSRYLIRSLEEATGASIELRRSEFVGPQVGAELRDQGGLGMLFALAVVMIYVAIRFQYKFSIGAVAALIHDVIIVLGFFALLGLDFDLTVLAAVLAVIGYSLNDTIVVFDRIRENFRKMRRGTTNEVINTSLTQTLERTLLTSLTTLLVLVVLFIFGGELISGFATALIVGVVVGTYSSIYVSANTLAVMHLTKEDLMPPPKEGEDQEEVLP